MEEAVAVVETRSEFQQMTFQEAVQKHDIVSADDGHGTSSPYVVLAESGKPKVIKGGGGLGFREMAYSSPSPWTAWTREERVPQLRDKQGIRTYYDMKRADGTVRGSLRILKTPIQAAEWFVKPATDSSRDKKIAEFIEDNLFNRLNVTWSRFIEDALTMCELGFAPFEKVYTYDSDEKIRLKKLAHRHPLDVREWLYDGNGGPDYLVMEPLEISGWEEIVIPISKLLVFVFEQEGGDLRGTSVLRSAYQHYYYKKTLYAIDAIQKERHGIGVPLIKLPMGFTTEDRKLADDLGRNLRTNERAHITAPSNWEISFAKLEGQPVSCLDSIKHHDTKIMSNVLAPFLDDPTETDKQDMFYKSTRYIASTIADTINKYCIQELVDYNFMRHGGYPKLMVRRIGEWQDIRTMTFAARNLVGAQMLTPDEPLEAYIRDQLFLPPMDPATARITSNSGDNEDEGEENDNTKKKEGEKEEKRGNLTDPRKNVNPPNVGSTRQKSDPPVKLPQANSGTDRSGG